MTCPMCGKRTHVVESRDNGIIVRRRRECKECKFRFTTYEQTFVRKK